MQYDYAYMITHYFFNARQKKCCAFEKKIRSDVSPVPQYESRTQCVEFATLQRLHPGGVYFVLPNWFHTIKNVHMKSCFWLRPSSSMNSSVRLSVPLSVCHTFLTMFISLHHQEIFRINYD